MKIEVIYNIEKSVFKKVIFDFVFNNPFCSLNGVKVDILSCSVVVASPASCATAQAQDCSIVCFLLVYHRPKTFWFGNQLTDHLSIQERQLFDNQGNSTTGFSWSVHFSGFYYYKIYPKKYLVIVAFQH